MRSGIKYVALGLAAGASATALFGVTILFFAPQTVPMLYPSSTPTTGHLGSTIVPSSSPAASLPSAKQSAFTPVLKLMDVAAAPSAQPSVTPDAAQVALSSGSMVMAGPLSTDEQIALYRSSLSYVRSTTEDSRRLAKQINGVGYGDPSNICGPLAAAILRDARLLPASTIPHDFWLLNPNAGTDAHILETAFPWMNYSHFFIATPINKTDWRSTPLLPGDFVFLWHGSGGNFDHMLVVTRVDSGSRAYTVTNYGTEAGFVIAEALLYDPADSTAGLFHQWTAERDAILGSTGFGGLEVWRRRAP